MAKIVSAGLFALVLTLTGTVQPAFAEKRCDGHASEILGIIGAIGGAYLGNRAGRGGGRLFATLLGGAMGGWIGSKIGEDLDCESQKRMAAATSDALQNDTPQSWSNQEEGTSGQVSVSDASQEVAATHPNQQCRTAQQSVTLSDGRTETHTVQACRNEDGSWSPIES